MMNNDFSRTIGMSQTALNAEPISNSRLKYALDKAMQERSKKSLNMNQLNELMEQELDRRGLKGAARVQAKAELIQQGFGR